MKKTTRGGIITRISFKPLIKFQVYRTVLHWAIIRNAWEIFNLLLDADVIIDMPDNDGREPLHEACSVGNMSKICEK
jgi:ankyrin repeat protein